MPLDVPTSHAQALTYGRRLLWERLRVQVSADRVQRSTPGDDAEFPRILSGRHMRPALPVGRPCCTRLPDAIRRSVLEPPFCGYNGARLLAVQHKLPSIDVVCLNADDVKLAVSIIFTTTCRAIFLFDYSTSP